MLKKALTCGTFLMSSNAISADGQLVNIDGAPATVWQLCASDRSRSLWWRA